MLKLRALLLTIVSLMKTPYDLYRVKYLGLLNKYYHKPEKKPNIRDRAPLDVVDRLEELQLLFDKKGKLVLENRDKWKKSDNIFVNTDGDLSLDNTGFLIGQVEKLTKSNAVLKIDSGLLAYKPTENPVKIV